MSDGASVVNWAQRIQSNKTTLPLLKFSRPSKVYFVQENGILAIKIGTTKDVDARVRGMNVSTPHTLVVLAVIDGNYEMERLLHRRFAHVRIRGEWFRPVPELLEYIASLKGSQ